MANVDNILDFMITNKGRAKDAKDTYKALKNPRMSNGIRAKARGLILQYPVLISDAITPESASAVARTLEHEYANLLTLLINDNSIVDDAKSTNTTKYLSQFHANLENTDIEKWAFRDANKQLVNETDSNIINETSLNDYTLDREIVRTFNEAMTKDERDDAKLNLDKDKAKVDNFGKMIDAELKASANITSNEVKKLNDAVPTLIKGVINYTDGNGVVIPKVVNFGVKVMCHPVKSSEMKFNLANKVGNSSLLTQFIQWTTGEKRLLTDIVMQRKTMKNLASNKYKSNYWFRKLEKMANDADNKALFQRFMKHIPFGSKIGKLFNLDREMPIPCVSLVVSKSEVEQIEAETGVNLLSNKNFAKEVMNRFYLLSLVVVDDVTSTAYFYNDVTGRFIQYSMKQLKGFAKDDMLTPEEALKKSLMR